MVRKLIYQSLPIHKDLEIIMNHILSPRSLAIQLTSNTLLHKGDARHTNIHHRPSQQALLVMALRILSLTLEVNHHIRLQIHLVVLRNRLSSEGARVYHIHNPSASLHPIPDLIPTCHIPNQQAAVRNQAAC